MHWTKRALAFLAAALMIFTLNARASDLQPAEGYDSTHPELLEGDYLYAQSAILMDYETGQVLFEKNPDREMAMASTTKIMTCMLALEHFGEDLDVFITIPPEAADVPDGSSRVPVTVGEQMTVRDLLYGLMLHSGNDAANAVAVLVSGSLDQFVSEMNRRAEKLGCEHTHFVNAHGYTAEGHYTTVRDMALIAREAMKNQTFRTIVRTIKYTMPASNARGAKILTNTNLWGASTGMYKYKYGNGIKTGFTSAAGQCLVGSATNDEGVTLISVVFRSTTNNAEAKWLDSTKIMNYGFSRYTRYSFDQLYDMAPVKVQLENASEEDELGGEITLKAIRNTAANTSAVLLDINVEDYLAQFAQDCRVDYTVELTAPIEENAIVGNLTYTAPDGTSITALLTADRSVEAARHTATTAIHDFFENNTSWLLIAIVALFLLLFIVWRISAAVKRREKRRRRIERARRRALQQKKQQQAAKARARK